MTIQHKSIVAAIFLRYNINTQKELSEASGVKLRMIQLYEQRENDINKARAGTLYDLSKALGCDMEDLMEPELDTTLDELQNVIAI